MAFSPTDQSDEYHYVAVFSLDTTTIRWADEDLSVSINNSSGWFAEGRLPETGTIVRDIGSLIEAKESIDNYQLEVDNHDLAVQALIDQHTFGGRAVDIYAGRGVSWASYSQVFSGFVAVPNGVEYDEDAARFMLVDRRHRMRRDLPLTVFSIDDYPDLEDKAKGLPIPIIYGDYSSTVAGGVTVPAYCTDMASADKAFRVSRSGLKSVGRVVKNAVALSIGSEIKNIDLNVGTFDLDFSVEYNSTTDIISVNCEGIQTAGGTLIEKPGDTAKNLQTAFLGLTGTDLDATAYSDLNNDTSTQKMRRWIGGSRQSSELLLNGLWIEAQVDARYIAGKSSPKFRVQDVVSYRDDYRENDILLVDDTEKADWHVSYDPDRIVSNKITARYGYDPINAAFIGSYQKQATAQVDDLGTTIDRVWDFNWLYQAADIKERVDRESAMFSTEPRVIEIGTGPRAVLKNLADQIDLTYRNFADRPLQIRRAEIDLGSMTVRIKAWDLFTSSGGRWAADSDPDYDDASGSQRFDLGFWANAAGFASASDTSSNVSRWF